MTVSVTRYNTYTRPASEEEGLDEREVVRLFEKRKLVGEFEIDDIAREDWEEGLSEMIKAGESSDGRNHYPTLEEVMDFLSSDAEDDEEEEREPGSIVPEKYRIIYGSAQNCGDEIALALTAFVTTERTSKKNPDGGLDRAKLRGVAEENGIGDRLAQWEDNGLNGGLLRMNTSNVLRGMNRRGERVVIGAEVWEAREVAPKAKKTAPKKQKETKKS